MTVWTRVLHLLFQYKWFFFVVVPSYKNIIIITIIFIFIIKEVKNKHEALCISWL